jgi:hypothetical protein
METVTLHGPRLGVGRLCRALALPRATYYRHLTPGARLSSKSAEATSRREHWLTTHVQRTALAPCDDARASAETSCDGARASASVVQAGDTPQI